MTLDKDSGMNLLGEAIEVMRDITFEKGGQMEVKMVPRVVSLRRRDRAASYDGKTGIRE